MTIQPAREIITQVSVNILTGVQTTVTNSPAEIRNTIVRTHAIDTILATRVELTTYTIESIVERRYETQVEETILFLGPNNQTAQVTVSVNPETNVVVEIGYVKPAINLTAMTILPVVHEETLGQGDLQVAIVSNPVISEIITLIHEGHPELVAIQPVTTVIEEMETTIKMTVVFMVDGKKQRIVVIKNGNEEKPVIIEEIVTLPVEIKPITSIVKIDPATGIQTQISNDLTVFTTYISNIQQIINDVKIKVPSLNTEQIEYIESTQLSNGNSVIVISESNGVTVEVDFTINQNG